MRSNDSNGCRAASARGFIGLWTVLTMGLGMVARPAEAAPFAYVANLSSNNISVIDTATNEVVATVRVGNQPLGVAVTPDGKHAYVANNNSSSVSVIDTATNLVVTTVAVGLAPIGIAVSPDGEHAYVTTFNDVSVIDTATNMVVATVAAGNGGPIGVAVTPDGEHAYVTNESSGNVSVIDTATNKVVATVGVGNFPEGVAVTPDGKRAYVANNGDSTVSMIDTATNVVAATVAVGSFPFGVAVTPDGKHIYVAHDGPSNVSVIDTATNVVAATVAVGAADHFGVAVAPDGKHAYVANRASNTVSVIDTATNTEAATVAVRTMPFAIGIVPPPRGVPFLAFNAQLAIDFGATPNQDAFELHSQFTLSSTEREGIKPVTESVTLQVGTFTIKIPPGSFSDQNAAFTFVGVIHGVSVEALIKPTGTLRYAFRAEATGASLTGTKNDVQVSLIIGDDSGTTSVKAKITH